MTSAVFRSGGKQFRVAEGDTVRVKRLAGEPGDEVVFDDVLLVGGDKPKIGRPTVRGAQVKAQILCQDRSAKVVVFKFKRRKKYRRRAGHRQDYTEVRITGITG
jgi:large subunit ribosomal protein L21